MAQVAPVEASPSGPSGTLRLIGTRQHKAQTGGSSNEVPSLVVDADDDIISATDGKTTLREAIAYAATLAGQPTVSFDAAFFATPRTLVLESDIRLTHPVSVTGPGASTCTVRGSGTGRLFSVAAGAGDVVISGLSLSHGRAEGAGGAIFNEGRLSLRDVVLEDNLVRLGEGGALFNETGATARIEGCTLRSNGMEGWSSVWGGAVRNNGTLHVAASTFIGNVASTGGAISNGGSATIVNSVLRENIGRQVGGALSNMNGYVNGAPVAAALSMRGCTLDGNIAFHGGGIHNAARLRLFNSTLSGNQALRSQETQTPFDDDFWDGGGGIMNENWSEAEVVNCTLYKNFAQMYGGALNNKGRLSLRNCTVVGNNAGYGGGGFYGYGDTAIGSTLVALNTSSSAPDVSGVLSSHGHNLIGQGDSVGTSWRASDRVGTSTSPLDPGLEASLSSRTTEARPRPLLSPWRVRPWMRAGFQPMRISVACLVAAMRPHRMLLVVMPATSERLRCSSPTLISTEAHRNATIVWHWLLILRLCCALPQPFSPLWIRPC
jgi:hypothetical protein